MRAQLVDLPQLKWTVRRQLGLQPAQSAVHVLGDMEVSAALALGELVAATVVIDAVFGAADAFAVEAAAVLDSGAALDSGAVLASAPVVDWGPVLVWLAEQPLVARSNSVMSRHRLKPCE